jgi:hypothetical protein
MNPEERRTEKNLCLGASFKMKGECVPKGEISMYAKRGAEMAITFNDHDFSDPIEINHWIPPRVAGLFAILIPDTTASPQHLRAIYFGESGDLSDREFFKTHQKYRCWLQWASSEDNLFIATYLMPSSSAEERFAAKSVLISSFQPPCNS